jgi:cytochrome c
MSQSIHSLPGVLLCLLALGGAAVAATPEVLATKAGCIACHTPKKKLVGPSYHDIAVKYHADAKAPAALAAKVRSGGAGTWGKVKMLPIDAKKITDADLAAVIAWILKQ